MKNKKFQRNIRIAISSVCNMNCVYCDGNKGYRNDKMGAMEDMRRTPLENGNITTDELLEILKVFRKVGFNGITLTGGEPMLNKDWDRIVNEAADMGFERREITTNGLLLGKYFNEHGKLPDGLTLVKVSFDTADKKSFKEFTGGGDLDKVAESVKTVSPYINIRANKVMLRKDLENLEKFLNYCKSIGFKAVNLLELVTYPHVNNTDENKKFFQEQFVPYEDMVKELDKIEKLKIDRYKYGHIATTQDGFQIMATDSKYTIRDEQCEKCPIYCQAGKFTVRIATDGNITMCPDYKAEIYSINGLEELRNNTLEEKLKKMFDVLSNVEEVNVFEDFKRRYDLV